jgi:hypothetical protein
MISTLVLLLLHIMMISTNQAVLADSAAWLTAQCVHILSPLLLSDVLT